MHWSFWDDPLLPRLRLCRLALGLSALALGLLCASNIALEFAPLLGVHQFLGLLGKPFWIWGIEPVITWGSLLGAILFLGRWDDPSWQRCAGLLVLLDAVDAGTWLLSHAQALGISERSVEAHGWLITLLTLGTGWIELLLTAALAEQVAHQAGDDGPAESGARFACS